MEKIEFTASLPDIQSAVNISGGKNGARIKLDIPETDIAQAAKLILMRGLAFKVTLEIDASET